MEWPLVKLGDVCGFQNGFAFKSRLFTDSGFPILRISNIQDGRVDLKRIVFTDISSYAEDLDRYKVKKDDLLIAMSGATTGKIGINHTDKTFLLNQRVGKLIPGETLDKHYLYYYLSTKVQEHLLISAGSAQPNLSTEQIKSLVIPLPPIPEQQRIVAILDQAFADIEKARANAEKNLKNARELFDSYLNQVSADKKPLGRYVTIKTGKLNSNAATENGAYPFFTCSRDIFSIDSFSFDCEAILLAGNNASGDFNVKHYCGKFDAYQRTYVITINEVNQLSYTYLYYQMIKSLRHLKSSSVGAGTKFLKIGMIENLEISIPSLAEQQRILGILEPLKENIEQLENSYKTKLKALDELKKSLLQKAFSGELTKTEGHAA